MRWYFAEITNGIRATDPISLRNIIKEEFGIKVYEKTLNEQNCYFTSCETDELSGHVLLEEEGIILVGDIELYNSIELVNTYGLDSLVSNESILIKLYKKLGIDFIKELIGDFSFVLFDSNSGRCFTVRDHLGVRTAFWVKKNDSIFIASDIFILKNLFEIKDLEKSYFKEFVNLNGITDNQLTPYKSLNRVPSGSYLQVYSLQCELKEYWDLTLAESKIDYLPEREYQEQFKQIFITVVRDRLIKNKMTSIMLSGGLDSTSIYAASKEISNKENSNLYQISSISAVFNELKESDEQVYIDELLEKYGDQGHYKVFDHQLMYENFPHKIPFSYEPHVSALTFEFTNCLVGAASENGAHQLLTGFAGDQLLTGSLDVTHDLLKRRKIKQAFSYVTNYSIATNSSAFQNFFNYTLRSKVLKREVTNKESTYYKTIRQKMKRIKYSSQKQLYFQISNSKAHLYMDRTIGAFYGIDIKHPMLDRRLVEFVYRLPGELKFSDYHNKYILRSSLGDLLTDRIKNRLNKTTHLAYTYKSIRKNWQQLYEILSQPKLITKFGFISLEEWHKELLKWRNGIAVIESFWVFAALELWATQYDIKFNH